jgi:hypothetical protein
MSKKTVNINELTQDTFDEVTESTDFTDAPDPSSLAKLDFNVKDEYKAPPLIPTGNGYHAACMDVTFDASKHAIVWDLCLHDNGGVMSDEETPIDGARVYYRNWLPKPGDENIPTKSGKSSKRQAKINMLRDFSSATELSMDTPQEIATALSEGLWIGMEFDVDISVKEWKDRFSNEVIRIRCSTI